MPRISVMILSSPTTRAALHWPLSIRSAMRLRSSRTFRIVADGIGVEDVNDVVLGLACGRRLDANRIVRPGVPLDAM